MDVRLSLAVVDDQYFYRMGAKRAHQWPLTSLKELLMLAEYLNATHVWVLAGTEISRLASEPVEELQGWSLRSMTNGKRLAWVSAVRTQARFETDRIQIGFCEHVIWPWLKRDNPRTMLATVAHLEDALHLPIEWTPAHMALEYIKKKNASRWSWLAPLTMDLEKQQPGFRYGLTCKEVHWAARTCPDTKYLIKTDDNSRYGASMTGLRVGEGNPIRVGKPGSDGMFDIQAPGFWKVNVQLGASLFDGEHLPDFRGYPWMTTDMIGFLQQAGYDIEIEEGWMWERYHQTLRSTVASEDRTGLWDLRLIWRGLREESTAHDNVYESISAILHTVHGKIGDADLSQEKFYRPDMYAMVVARSVGLGVYWTMKIKREYGIVPCVEIIDAKWYGVNDPHLLDPELTAEKLGRMKHMYTLEVTDEVRAAFAAKTPDGVAALLNKIASRQRVDR